jgi:hypothetical protein
MTKGKWLAVGFFVVGTGLWIAGIALKNWVPGVIAFVLLLVAAVLAVRHFL